MLRWFSEGLLDNQEFRVGVIRQTGGGCVL